MPIVGEESWLFLRKFMQYPKQVGSIAPSSPYLAQEMLRHVKWDEVASLAELGAGTGAITRAIARKVRPETRVYLFEKDAGMRQTLAGQYPAFVCWEDAARLKASLAMANDREPLDCIVSGLPFANFSTELRARLLQQIESALKPNGLFVAFQYSLQMRSRLAQSFDIERIGFVVRNLPPAFVYVCRKRGK
ncbi:MAG: methyltransferase domain-containing protein [Paenibacillaceae bacterium]|nr:methyltransferase domain-containing protein [Paenibacillaceae bacterium]